MNDIMLLLVEDNEKIMNTNAKALRLCGYTVSEARNLCEAYDILDHCTPHLIVLDIMLPDGSGLDFCCEIRKNRDIPVLFLTALGEMDDMLRGYEAGGIEYISKPYSMELLIAKIGALLRLVAYGKNSSVIILGELRIDTEASRAYLREEDLLLTHKEYDMLLYLARNRNRYISAEELYKNVWYMDAAGDVRSVWEHISRIRKKLRAERDIDIESARGKGYKLIPAKTNLAEN